MNDYQHIIDQCESAVRSLEGILSPSEFSKCLDDVLKYNEWLLGLEFAIDWLVENDRKISYEVFVEFRKAYELMNRVSDKRLQDLKEQTAE